MHTSHYTLPPFPSNLQTAPLVSISLAKLEAHDAGEHDALFAAAKDLGFFYMEMAGSPLGERIVCGAEGVNALQNRWWALPDDEKDRYGRPHLHDFFAYRYGEVNGTNGPGRNSNYNVGTSASPLT